MRIVLSTLLITVLFCFLAFYSVDYLEKSAQEMISLLNQVEGAIIEADWASAEEKLNNFQAAWEKNSIIWDILVEHQEIDNINISIAHIYSYVKGEELTECYGEIKALYIYLGHIPKKEKLTVKNLL